MKKLNFISFLIIPVAIFLICVSFSNEAKHWKKKFEFEAAAFEIQERNLNLCLDIVTRRIQNGTI